MQFNKNPCSWAENGASLGLRSEQTQPLSSRSSGPQGHLRCGALGCKSQELTQAKWSDQGNLWKTSGMCRRTQGHLGQGRDWKPELKQGHDPGHYSNPTSDLHIAALLILSISSPFLLILCAHAGNKWPPPFGSHVYALLDQDHSGLNWLAGSSSQFQILQRRGLIFSNLDPMSSLTEPAMRVGRGCVDKRVWGDLPRWEGGQLHGVSGSCKPYGCPQKCRLWWGT